MTTPPNQLPNTERTELLSAPHAPFYKGLLRTSACAASIIGFAGCSLFGPMGDDTDTVPLLDGSPGDDGSIVIESDDLSESEVDIDLEIQPMASGLDLRSEPIVPAPKNPTPITNVSPAPHRPSPADAWMAPRKPSRNSPPSQGELPTRVTSIPKTPGDSSPVPAGDTLIVPIPGSALPKVEAPASPLTLKEFRAKVFAVQQREEAARFRDAIGISSGANKKADGPTSAPTSSAGVRGFSGSLEDSDAPSAEPVGDSGKFSPDDPRVKAAYQVYRWNLMETLAGAERAYWRLHFANLKYEELKKSVNTLAGINDKARLGVLKKTREASDIVATETMRAHREVVASEADALRTAAMSEVASFYTPDAALNPGALLSLKPVLTEAPPAVEPSSPASALIERAKKFNPHHLADLLRDGDREPGADRAETRDDRIKERIESALQRLAAGKADVEKTRREAETYAIGLEENIRNFGAGKLGLQAITAFEKGLLDAREAHLNSLADYRDALLDLELEVGDFLETRGREIPLAQLLGK